MRNAGEQLLAAGLLEKAGDVPVAVARDDHADEVVSLTPSPIDGRMGYFSSTAGWITPDPEETAFYRLRFDVLFSLLLAGLDCRHAARPHVLLKDAVWDVGAARVSAR